MKARNMHGTMTVRFNCSRELLEEIQATADNQGHVVLPPPYDVGLGGRWTIDEAMDAVPGFVRLEAHQVVPIVDNGKNALSAGSTIDAEYIHVGLWQ